MRGCGGYRLGPRLGLGATSAVYAATDPQGRAVALKILHEEHSGHLELVLRFFNEQQAAQRVSHPGVVRIFDAGYAQPGRPYLAQELLGESLALRLGRGRPWPWALAALLPVAEGLAALHAAGVVHRDVKPHNLLFTGPGARGALKVVDLGLAKLRVPTGALPVSTATTDLLGSGEYRAPEQWINPKAVDGAADVYALGVTLYELLSGARPFLAAGDDRLMEQHLFDAPPPLPGLPEDVAALLAAMLAKRAAGRPPMARVAATLATLAAGVGGGSEEEQPLP